MPRLDDKVQIGLTKVGQEALDRIMGMGLFTNEGDAYKVAIAYSIAKQLPLAQAPEGGYATKFNAAGGLDRDGTVRDLVNILMPDQKDRPYATAEKLAEIGLVQLSERLVAQETLADILVELHPGARVEENPHQDGV